MVDTTGGNTQVTVGGKVDKLTEYSLKVLKEIMLKAGVDHANVTSLARTAGEQARIMYNNVSSGDATTGGVANQKKLYSASGDAVIDVYDLETKAGTVKDEIIARMTKKIEDLNWQFGHANLDAGKQVFDVGPNSISPADGKQKFVDAVKADSRVTGFKTPDDGDPGYHLEIVQPAATP